MRTKVQKEEKKKFDLDEACVLWKNTSKGNVDYLKGHDLNGNRVIGFINDNTNTKLPKIRVYSLKDNGETDKEIITLWEVKSQQGRLYLSGTTSDDENVIGFYGDEASEKTPYIKIYFKED